MFRLSLQDIHLGALPKSKTQAIREIASALVKANYVRQGYVNGMLSREQQSSTYLGNGIAIPHGTLKTRSLVKQTGVQVFQFPNGVRWGDEGQPAYVAIGIAARSDEHLTLLRQLTNALNQDGIKEKLAAATTAKQLRSLLLADGHKSDKSTFHTDRLFVSLGVSADDLMTLQAVNAGLLHKASAVDASFIADAVARQPVHLGQGIWLNDSQHGNLANAVAVSRPTLPIGHSPPVALLITASVVDDALDSLLKNLAVLLLAHRADELLTANETKLISLFSQATAINENGMSAEFTLVNKHGLHTRPASLLVKVMKDFSSSISVANLNGTGEFVNATSLIKLVSIGAKKGDTLRFTAVGTDAQSALAAIGQAMAAGLGEETQ